MPKSIREKRRLRLTEAADTTAADSGRIAIEVISPGWGGSGYYSTDVCESAADLVAVGTQMFMDHPHQDGSGVDERGNRSVRDIAAVITEAGRWDPTAGDGTGAVVAEAQVVGPYRDVLLNEHLASSIGLSIRGSATDVAVGEAEGRRGPIIESLATIESVDFVTRAGRGGRITSVLESAPTVVVSRAIRHGVSEATADERRTQLSDVVRTAYGAEDRWVWVRDFDDTTVWFEISSEDDATKTWQQAYEPDDDDLTVALTGTRVEVRPVTKYVPTTRSDSTIPTTESQEDTMPKIQVEESVHQDALAKAGRVDALESENVALKEAAAERTRHDRAVELVVEALAADDAKVNGHAVTFTALEHRGLLADLPVKESALDEDAFKATVAEAVKAKVDEATAITESRAPLSGFGAYAGQPGTQTTPTSESATPTTTPWGRKIGA